MSRKNLLVLVLGLALVLTTMLACTVVSSADQVAGMQPYVCGPTTTSAWVLIECNSTATATVDYGTTTAYGSSTTTTNTETTTNTTYVHNIKLTGLSANTTYNFRVRQGATTTGNYSFTTAVNAGTNFRFVAAGDCRTNTANHDNTSGRMDDYNAKFFVQSGDVSNDSAYGTMKNEWLRANEVTLLSKTPMYQAPGNHEGWGQNIKAFTQGPADAGSNDPDYYSFDYGDVHFVRVNNFVSYGSGSAQWNFVNSDLANTSKNLKFVFNHYPAYCSGGHGEDGTMVSMATNIFVPRNVDVSITAHSHFYQHNRVSNIEYFVLGTYGAPTVSAGTASYTVKSNVTYHYGIFDITPSSWNLNVYDQNGTNIDTYGETKGTPGPTNTPTPSPTPGSVVFFSGLETNETQPTWTSTTESIANVTGQACAIGTSLVKVGSRSLAYSGTDGNATSSYCYFKVFDVNIGITADTILNYWFNPGQELGRHMSVDFANTDATNIRDSAATDTNGVDMHPGAGRGTINTWSEVTCNVGQWLNGKTIDRILVGWDYGPLTGAFTGAIDNIVIANGIAPSGTPGPTNTPAPTNTPSPTPTAGPTNTPTNTPVNTNTPTPSNTPTPTPTSGGGSVLFQTGLESGDTQPTWSNVVEVSAGVGGYTTGINPECATRTSEQQHAGTVSLMFSGTDNSTTSSYCYFKVFDVNIALNANTKLGYWFYPQQELGRHTAIDFVNTDATNIRDTAAVDQNSLDMHPGTGRGTINVWNQVKCNVGQWLSGKTVDRIVLGYDYNPLTGQLRGYYDDVIVTDGTIP